MKVWTEKHEALLNAISGEDVTPKLYKRLAQERLDATPEFVRGARDWVAALKADPGWELLEAAIDDPSAFPAVMAQASKLGFSDRTRHHFALVFENISVRSSRIGAFGVAAETARSAISMWADLLAGEYLHGLVADLETDLDTETISSIITETLVQTIERILQPVDDPAGEKRGSVVEQELRFYDDVLQSVQRLESNAAGVVAAVRWAKQTKSAFNFRLSQKIETAFNHADSTKAADDEQLLSTLRWFVSVHEVIGFSDDAASVAVSMIVDRLWELRKVGRDDDSIFSDLIQVGKPINVALFRKVQSGELFGQNGKCADFLVFEGERAKSEEKRKLIFETGLEICPGHRNSAMLLSYCYLRKAEELLIKIQVIPSARMIIKWGTSSVHDLLDEASRCLASVEEIYPFNERLEETKEKLEKERERLGV